MFDRTRYFFKQRSLARRSTAGGWFVKKEDAKRPEDLKCLRTGKANKRKSKRIVGPSFVKASSYQSFERAVSTEQEVRARRGTTRNPSPHKMVDAECKEASPFL